MSYAEGLDWNGLQSDVGLISQALQRTDPPSDVLDSEFPVDAAVRLHKLLFAGLEACLPKGRKSHQRATPVKDFFVRHLVVDDIWIPLGENVLIEKFKPVWNRAIDGFGNKDPGRRRATQYKSPWDVLHPGRKFADKLADGGSDAGILDPTR